MVAAWLATARERTAGAVGLPESNAAARGAPVCHTAAGLTDPPVLRSIAATRICTGSARAIVRGTNSTNVRLGVGTPRH